ncbi:MAG: PQQ-like beta-propeller repeat protein [Deltaproteobacteria bacterium]|nr:PQQ-like beta-propeller repeat protein [Deltaproteobacteria bacterium]
MAWLLLAILEAVALDVLFEVDLDSCSYGGASVGDLDADGDVEVLFGTYYNDEQVIALQDDGTPLWTLPSGGGPVDNSVTAVDLDRDGSLEVLWGNSQTTVFHVADATGVDLWTAPIGEVLDAPEAVGDLDGDGALDIVLASCGGGAPGTGLRAFTGSGDVLWRAAVGGCYQSAPLLFDQDGDGLLDVVVSTWFDDKVRAFSGLDGSLRWEATIGDWTYHAGSFGDLSGDGVPGFARRDLHLRAHRHGRPRWRRHPGGGGHREQSARIRRGRRCCPLLGPPRLLPPGAGAGGLGRRCASRRAHRNDRSGDGGLVGPGRLRAVLRAPGWSRGHGLPPRGVGPRRRPGERGVRCVRPRMVGPRSGGELGKGRGAAPGGGGEGMAHLLPRPPPQRELRVPGRAPGERTRHR